MLLLKALLARSIVHDVFASVVVFLVALPLSMGIAIASGVPMEKAASVGLVTAIIGGLVVGPLSGSPLQVSGPAAGLTVMVADFIQKYGFETLGIIVMIGGLVQIVAGLFRLGPVFRAVSPALIQGMLAGIGVLIFASQFHVIVDDEQDLYFCGSRCRVARDKQSLQRSRFAECTHLQGTGCGSGCL